MSNNNDNSAVAGVGLVLAVLGAIGIFFAVLLVFVVFIFTVLALLAWNKPLRLGKQVLIPEEARAFVKRGLFFAWAVPTFLVFVELFLEVRINWDYIVHMIVGGYTLGSIGIEILFADESAAQAPAEYILPPQQLPAQRIAWTLTAE